VLDEQEMKRPQSAEVPQAFLAGPVVLGRTANLRSSRMETPELMMGSVRTLEAPLLVQFPASVMIDRHVILG